jgi:SagB-type dehydrogenase family enzyme
MEAYRKSLKSDRWTEWEDLETDQRKELTPLPVQKPYPEDATVVDLIPLQAFSVGKMPLIEAMERRRSHRKYREEALTLEELSFLLWATQGVRKVFPKRQASLRTVPSGGARHPFETYLLVNRVEGVAPGLYRYLPLEHKICFVRADRGLVQEVHEACLDQYVEKSAVVFVWTAIPYRTEWRYDILAHKIIALDAGHVCQNLYLAAEAIGAGACAIGAYDQEKLDRALQVDGQDEFAVYVATLGKRRQRGG